MKRFIPVLFILVVIGIFFRQFFLQQLLPIPADDIVGLYYPFRDLYAAQYPRGVPFKNFLITDPVRQQYPWRFESITQEKNFQLPLWNPYSFAGTPLLANQQSAPFNPFNILFFLTSFPIAWSVLILLQPILAGFFLFLYLRNLKRSKLASSLASVAFIFSGFFTSWLEWGTIDFVAAYLPLTLLCVDKIVGEEKNKKQFLWICAYIVSLIFSFFAGYLQAFFYLFIIQFGYILFRLVSTKKKTKMLSVFLLSSLVFLLATAVQWIPLFQFIFLSARDSDLSISAGWFIPFQHIITFFIPDFFGNPTTLNYWGVWNYGELAGYIGIPALIFAFFSLFTKAKTAWFYVVVVFIAFLFALQTPLANIPLALHIPLLSTAQPTRLLFLIDFSLCILASYGFDLYRKQDKKIIIPIFFVGFVILATWVFTVTYGKFLPNISAQNISIAKHNLFFPSSIFGITSLLLLAGFFVRRKQQLLTIILCALVVVSVFDGMRFADKFIPFTKESYLFPKTPLLQFLQQNAGGFRIMTTDSQILPPNFSTMYHIEGIDGYDPLYSKLYGEFIAALSRGKPDISSPFGFNRIITPHDPSSRFIDLLGVKYVLLLTPIVSPKLKQVYINGQTRVYENSNVFPRAFFVRSALYVSSEQKEANFLFDPSKNLLTDAVVRSNTQNSTQFGIGNVRIVQYSWQKVILQTDNASDGFLVLTDTYYPTWHAYVDGKQTQIFPTDLAFRGILVPKGQHEVLFQDQLF